MTRTTFIYPRDGFFTELMREHNWPPGLVPSSAPFSNAQARQAATRSREAQLAAGNTGSIQGMSGSGDAHLRTMRVIEAVRQGSKKGKP